MSEYTTGELAKLAQVSVRTIQFYDKKEILLPSKKTDNGRRLYTDEDLNRLKLILMFKNLGLSLDSIKDILSSQNSSQILNLMLTQQVKMLKTQVDDTKQQLKAIAEIQRDLPNLTNIPINSITDIDNIMENKKSLRRVHRNMIIFGILGDIVEIGTLVYAIMTGNWWPFALGMIIIVLPGAALLTRYYFNETNYICPNCNYEFKPKFWTAFWARHNIRARKLTCPNCGQKNYCVEVFDDTKKSKVA